MTTKKNIILIGFMGTGKTAVGKRLAGLLNMKFYDTDQEIEKVTSMTINQLFNKHGEIRFRSEEALIIKKLTEKKNCVIATGGGIVLDQKNISQLGENGIIISLTAHPDVIYERVKRRNTRPLLKKGGDPYDIIISLLKEREELYKCADFSIDTSNLSFEEIINLILNFLKNKKQEKNNVNQSIN